MSRIPWAWEGKVQGHPGDGEEENLLVTEHAKAKGDAGAIVFIPPHLMT